MFTRKRTSSDAVQVRCRAACLLVTILALAGSARALTPDQIALVVNSRVPEGRRLAEFYAHERHIPDGRIIEVSLPPVSTISPAEEMPFADYEPRVAAPVRAFLTSHNLHDRVTCLVTFWGMPLRIGARRLTTAESLELGEIKKQLQ
ncbi:MAG TPA: hypothetical protein VN541_06380, partial [Tepidisphaeraceae bacterium]|nr:hypothetical protein [Tepidisphaeraceae bacterium]